MTVDDIFEKMDPRPRYDIQYDSLFRLFPNLRKNQLYLVAFMIGIRLNKCSPIPKGIATSDIYLLNNWSPKSQRDAIYYLLLKRSNDWTIPYSWKDMDNADEDVFIAFKREFCKSMDGFANAGFEFIKQKNESDQTYFKQPFALIDLLVEVADNPKQYQ